MWADNDNMQPRDYFMPKLSLWRWVGLALAFSVPILFLVAVAGLFEEGAALAQAPFTEPTQNLMRIIIKPERPDPAILARATANYCEEMLSLIPSNSPSEAAWIESELHTTDTAKIQRAVSSEEYARLFLVEMFTDCKLLSEKLIAESDTASREAAIHWTQLALTFQKAEDAKIHAARIGLYGEGNDVHGFNLLGGIRRAANLSVITTLERPQK